MRDVDLTIKRWLAHGWQTYKKSLKKIFVATLVILACSYTLRWLIYLPCGHGISLVLSVIVHPPLIAGYVFFCLKLTRGIDAGSRDFLYGFSHFGRVWLTNFLLTVIVMSGFALLLIPGILWHLKYGLSMIIVLDRSLGPLRAIRFSGKITNGYRAKLFLLYILTFGSIILTFPFVFGLGNPAQSWASWLIIVKLIPYLLSVFVITPWLCVAWTTAYDALNKRYEQANM